MLTPNFVVIRKSAHDKSGEPIEVGDHVETHFRGGKRAGEVWPFHDLKLTRR